MPMRPPAGFISAFYDPLKNPNAPTGLTATGGNTSASIAFTPPTNVGGSAISSYTAISTPGAFTGSAASSPVTVTGLTNGTAYTFAMWATNTYGPSAFSATSNSITPALPSFIANLYNAYGYSVVTDSSSNIYIFGIPSFSNVTQIAKYNSEGVLQWQKYIDVSPGGYKYKTAIDSSGNILIAIPASSEMKVYKLNSSGSIVWQRSINGWPSGCSGVYNEIAAVCTDSAGNVYIGSTLYYNCLYGYNVSKFNSSGTLQFSRVITNNVRASAQATGIVVDSSGGIYFTAGHAVSQYRVALIKLDSGGNLSWQRFFYDPSYSSYGTGIAVDSSNNVYITGQYNNSQSSMFIAKYNSSGTVQWNKYLDIGRGSWGLGIAVDSSANVYVCGQTSSGTYAMLMAKYNSSGTIQWQRQITGSGFNMYGYDVTVDANDEPVFIGYSYPGGSPRMFFGKFPSNGSKTGTYTLSGQTYTYAATTSTDTTNSPTYATSGVSAASVSLSASTPSNTVVDSGLSTGTTTL